MSADFDDVPTVPAAARSPKPPSELSEYAQRIVAGIEETQQIASATGCSLQEVLLAEIGHALGCIFEDMPR